MLIEGTLRSFSDKYYSFNIDEETYERLLRAIPAEFRNDKKPFTKRYLRAKKCKKTLLMMRHQQLGGREPVLVEAKPEEVRYMKLAMEVQIKPYNFIDPKKKETKRGVCVILLKATL